MLQWRRKLFHLLKCEKKFKAIDFIISLNLTPFGIPLGTTRDHNFWKKKKKKDLIALLSLVASRELVSHLFLLSPLFLFLCMYNTFKKKTFQTVHVFVTIVLKKNIP